MTPTKLKNDILASLICAFFLTASIAYILNLMFVDLDTNDLFYKITIATMFISFTSMLLSLLSVRRAKQANSKNPVKTLTRR